MDWIEIKQIDFVNAVIVALVMSLIVGIPLAIWTGVIMSRLSAFDQTRMTTCRILSELMNLVRAKSYDELIETKIRIGQDLAMVQGEFVRLRQVNAAAHANFFMARLLQAPWGDPHPSSFPLNPHDRDAYMKRLADYVSAFEKMIFDERPLMGPVLTLRSYVSSTEPMRQPDLERMKRREKAAMTEVMESRKKSQSGSSTESFEKKNEAT